MGNDPEKPREDEKPEADTGGALQAYMVSDPNDDAT